MIKLTTLEKQPIEIFAADIRRHRGSGYGTWIEMNSGVDFYVTEDFDIVDEMIENFKK